MATAKKTKHTLIYSARIDKKLHLKGEEVELTEEQVKELTALGAIAAPEAPAKEASE